MISSFIWTAGTTGFGSFLNEDLSTFDKKTIGDTRLDFFLDSLDVEELSEGMWEAFSWSLLEVSFLFTFLAASSLESDEVEELELELILILIGLSIFKGEKT